MSWTCLLEDRHLTVCFQEVTYHGERAQLVHHLSLHPEENKTLLRKTRTLVLLSFLNQLILSRYQGNKAGSVTCEISTERTSAVHSLSDKMAAGGLEPLY